MRWTSDGDPCGHACKSNPISDPIGPFQFEIAHRTHPRAMPTKSRPSTSLGMVTLVLTLLGWASVPLFLRHFADLIDGWTSNGWRYGFSALVWLPVLIVAWFGKGL